MKLSHRLRATKVAFDDPNLVSSAGLVPIMALAEAAGLRDLADERLSVPSDKGANPGLKVASLVAGMVAGADSIDDMALLRHGGMGRVFTNAYAPSTLGSFLRAFTFGHVRQLDAVAARFLAGLAGRAPLLPIPPGGPPPGGPPHHQAPQPPWAPREVATGKGAAPAQRGSCAAGSSTDRARADQLRHDSSVPGARARALALLLSTGDWV